MLLPRTHILYENLNTTFIQFDALLTELQNTQFTGYVQVVGWEYEGILMFDMGRIVNAAETLKEQKRLGATAAAGIVSKGKEKDHVVNVFRLDVEVVPLLANLLASEPLYKDLSSDLTSLDKLVAKLQSEKHAGAIVVRWINSPDTATILLRKGQVIECAWSTNLQVLSGASLLNQIIQAAAKTPTLLTVYRADLAQVYSADVDLTKSLTTPKVLALWQDVLNLVAEVTDRLTKAETFYLAFRRVCVDQTAVYPFLDPFAGEFEYRNGQLRFEGQATVARFNAALADCLALTVRELASRYAAVNLIAQLHTAAAQMRAERAAQLEQAGLTTLLPEVFRD
jgi:hypothetical protein